MICPARKCASAAPLRGGAFSYEQDTPALKPPTLVQGYLAHKETPPPLLGPS